MPVQSSRTAPALDFSSDGWCSGVRKHPSPHFDERPAECVPTLLVIHNISLPPGQFATGYVDGLFCGTLDYSLDPSLSDLKELRVSSHFFITRQGETIQYVSCLKRAWHAGVSAFQGRGRCNDFSIGIELEGTDFSPFEDAQYRALAELTEAIFRSYPIRAVTGHSDIAPRRKTDPGPFFDWQRYRKISLRALGVR